MSTYLERVGMRIRTARERAGLSQAQLATLADRTQTAVSYWEAGRREAGLQDLFLLARLLDVPLIQLLADDEPAQPAGFCQRAIADARAHDALSQQAWHTRDFLNAVYESGVAAGLRIASAYGLETEPEGGPIAPMPSPDA